MEKIFIIDSLNYLFRSYYAIGPMTNNQGNSTSALFGFIRSIKKLINDFSPKYLVCVFDGPDNKASRQKLYSEYKMNRKKAPDDLYPQIDLASKFCDIANIPTICIEGHEADDAMASVANYFTSNLKMKVNICSSDKDMLQLVSDDILVLNVHKDNLFLDEKAVIEKYLISPKQMLDYLAIVGDKSDNIPGIEGFGPKTAASLLNDFNTLENIYENINKIKSEKRKTTLIKEKEKAFLSKKLATLNLDLDVPKELGFYELKKPNLEKLESFYKEMNFLTFLKELNIENLDKKEDFLLDEKLNYILINSEKDFLDLVRILENQKEIVIDAETTSLNFMEAKLVGVGFCFEEKKAYYVPLNGSIDKDLIISNLKYLLENENISFIGHNIKYDYHTFLNHNIEIKNISFDTILASYLLNPQNRRHSLDNIVLEKFSKNKIPITELIGKKNQISMSDVSLESISNYCSEDVDYTLRLKNIFERNLKEKGLLDLFNNIEIPLIKVLAKMERKGIYINTDKLSSMSKDLSEKLNLLEGEIFSEAGKKFNINSPKQLAEILYVDLNLPSPRKKASSFSTSADILDKLKGKSPIIDHILKYRELKKLLSTYVDALPNQINPRTNRVHSTFSQSTTATGRLASKDPNLQNIPIKTLEGRKIREGFEPEKGFLYLSSDYSQIELRLLAHFSSDPNLLKAFNAGDDIHSYTAHLIFSVPIEEVTKDMRNVAKTVNFGIIYGQSAYSLSELLNITFKQAKNFIDTYFQRYKQVSNYLKDSIKNAYTKKVAYTITNRQRPIFEIDNKNPIIKAAAERLAVNTPLQGSSADLIKIAMVQIQKEIEKLELKGKMILQIHDELLFEVPENEIDIFKELVKDKMENALKLKVPLVVDIEIGKNLSEC